MNKSTKSARSYLFVPANRTERFEKALSTQADAVIIDLEDAVPPELKISARESLKVWLADHPNHHIMIRVNSAQTEWFKDDIQLTHFKNVQAIVLPKTEFSAEIDSVLNIRPIDIFPLIETPLGLANVRKIAQAISIPDFMYGSIFFHLEKNMQGGNLE